jgi:hypothetical protein
MTRFVKIQYSLCVVLVAAIGALAVVSATSAGASRVRTCGYVHASVPYSSSGQADRWRVYVKGSASCTTAVKVLDAVMHRRGKPHFQGGEANSYNTYRGWVCPFGHGGVQICQLPARLPDHPPIRAHALALGCTLAEHGCPLSLPPSDL